MSKATIYLESNQPLNFGDYTKKNPTPMARDSEMNSSLFQKGTVIQVRRFEPNNLFGQSYFDLTVFFLQVA